jgi:transposase
MAEVLTVIYRWVCGLDVHKKSVMACVRGVDAQGQVVSKVRRFGTMTRDLLELGEWLKAMGVTHVAMESTGVFWKPIYNLLEGSFEVILVNARHIKQVPGRKTDVKDCEWIAQLLQCGLLRASFVPPKPIRELRDLTRHRATLTQQRAAVINRVHKLLEDANIKLAAVASDVLGVSGRQMLEAMIRREESAEALAELAQRRLRAKIPQLRLALEGHVTDHHRFLLQDLLAQMDFLDTRIAAVSKRIEEVMPSPFAAALETLVEIPGFHQRTAENVLAEIGVCMEQFPSAAHLASWAGVCPGNNESAGKRKSGKTPKGNRWLRRALGEAAWAAARTKASYFNAQFRRLSSRRGPKRAAVAVQHSLLVVVYQLLRNGLIYEDLGPHHFDRMDSLRLRRHHIAKLEALGFRVTLEPLPDVA